MAEPDVEGISVYYGIMVVAILLLIFIDILAAKYLRGDFHKVSGDESEDSEDELQPMDAVLVEK